MRSGDNTEHQAGVAEAEESSQGSLLEKLWRGAGRAFTSPGRLLPKREIAEVAGLIKGLADAIKQGPRRKQGIIVEGDRSFNLAMTAQFYGVSLDEFEAVLARRRYMTMRFAYLAFILGWLFFLAWCYQLIYVPGNIGFMVLMFEYAPFCLVFFLLSFRSALLNFQIRTLRLATAAEYLHTSEKFWPS